MGDILSQEDFPAIRVLLGNIGSDLLSDCMVEFFPFLPAVEISVKMLFPTWAAMKTESGNDWTLVKTGTACLTAYALANKMLAGGALGGGFSVGGYTENAAGVDWTFLNGMLRTCVSSAFSQVSTATPPTRKTLLIASGPTSSGANVPVDYEAWIQKVLPDILVWEMEEGADAY